MLSISAAAYNPVYEPIIGASPKPAHEDYSPRIEQGEVWILETNLGAVGTLVLERHADHVLVYSIAVLPEHQRQGHARRLLRFAEDYACNEGYLEIRLYTNDQMTRNLNLYRSCGYVETRRRPHPTRACTTLVDLAKSLDC